MPRLLKSWGVAALALGQLAFPASAAPPSAASGASLTLAKPVSIVKTADLDFGSLTVTSGGTAVVDPNTSQLSVTGGVVRIGGSAQPARFEVSASRLALIVIRVPDTPITLTRIGGTEQMTVSNWTLNRFFLTLVDQATPIQFAVGGTLNVAANQVEGTYQGTFPVTVDYF